MLGVSPVIVEPAFETELVTITGGGLSALSEFRSEAAGST
jgi:hypothetical protein